MEAWQGRGRLATGYQTPRPPYDTFPALPNAHAGARAGVGGAPSSATLF
jgi:hypothetical protein